MAHPELTTEGELLVIVDFTIVIIPDKDRINLDAIIDFIIDLRVKGKIKLGLVSFDQYQSSAGLQRLLRYDIEAKKYSVDIDINAYYSTVSLLKNEKIKCGKNIILKNNLKSLQESYSDKGKKKIDHIKGRLVKEYNNDWDNSPCGINAKDCSDGLAGVVNHILTIHKGVPRYIFYENLHNPKDNSENFINFINDKYGLIAN